MTRRRLAARAFVFLITMTLGSSIWASCVEDATSTDTEQMACCKAGHVTCGTSGGSDDCCKHAVQASPQFTATEIVAPRAEPVAAAVFHAVVAPTSPWFLAGGMADTSSPPGSRPPTYLLLSTLRL